MSQDNNALAQELQACPFCGEQPKHKEFTGNGFTLPRVHYTQVICPKCKIGTEPIQPFETDRAIAAWNTRAQPAPASGEVVPTLRQAFRTTVSGNGGYEMVFRFPSMADMHRADDEWRDMLERLAVPPQPTQKLDTKEYPDEIWYTPEDNSSKLYVRKDLAQPTQQPGDQVDMRAADMKALWKEYGGDQHGPHVEQYYIKEADWYKFAKALYAKGQQSRAALAAMQPASPAEIDAIIQDGQVSAFNEFAMPASPAQGEG